MVSKDTVFSKKRTLNIRGKIMDLSTPKIMGILNITPDSFYDGAKYLEEKNIRGKVEKIISEGADFIDVGAYSSRPGAQPVTVEEELSRLTPVISMITRYYPEAVLSVDTFRADVARSMVEGYGVDMINDVSAGRFDPAMFRTVADLRVPYVVMHMQGTPADMQNNPQYEHVVREVITFLSHKVCELSLLGVNDVIVDPGFGFGKTLEHNYQILSHLQSFNVLELPLMVGISRKSMIYHYFDSSPSEALNGTIVLHTVALLKGADILRVHDVKEAVETIRLVEKLKQTEQ